MTSGSIPVAFSDPARKPRLALIRGVAQGSFFERYLRGALSMAEELGFETAQLDAPGEAMAVAIQQAADQRFDAIVLSTGNLDTLRPAVDEALAHGLAVVGVDMTGEHPRVPSLEQDDMWIGFLLSRKLALDFDGKAEVLYLNPGEFAPLAKRDRAWQDFKWRYPGLHELERAGAVTGHVEPDTEQLVLELLRKHPQTDAVLATWDELARGAVRAVRRSGMQRQVRVYSVDVGDADLAMMSAPGSPWAATVATDPRNIGRVAVRAAAALIARERVDKYLLVEPQLVTQEFVRANRIENLEGLLAAMPTLGASRLLWFDWMERLLERNGHKKPIATLAPEQLINLSKELREANAALEAEIAERSRIEGELRFANVVLSTQQQTAPDGILVVDASRRVLSYNRRFLELWLLSETLVAQGSEAMLAQVKRRLVDPERFVAEVDRIYADRQARTREEVELVGRVFFERISAPMLDARGDYLGRVWYFRDITDRKRAEESLREADRRKDEFLAVLSHELRNPLSPIRISLSLLARSPAGSPAALHAFDVIDRQTAHLTRLVDDLLDVTRITRGKLQLERERVELGGIVRRTAEDYQGPLAAAGVRLELHVPADPLWLEADSTRIAQIVGNLLGNSAKFTPAGGTIDLALERQGEEAVLRVRDTGLGIEPDVLGRLFRPFSQAAQTLERARGGLGLGLALVKGLAEMHGGSIAAASEGRGKGALFTLRLPLSAAQAVVAPAPPAAALQVRRVLVIEDNVDAAESMQALLELGGHEVKVAFDGPSGLAAARQFLPEVVFCDIGLPGMDGYEVARAMRADERLRGTKLVALTGYALPEDRRRAREAGFDNHVAKPPPIEVIDRILAEP